jgi:hypothetical protein
MVRSSFQRLQLSPGKQTREPAHSCAAKRRYHPFLERLEDRTLLSAYVSVQSGNWSNTATWGGAGVPGAGDTATIASGTTVTVDQNTVVGSNSSAIGNAITIQGSSASTYGVLQVGAGVIVTLRGYDTTQNTLMLINRYGQFNPQPGSTILGDVAGNYSSIILNKGQINAAGTAASPVTFSSPAANVSWNTAITESHSNVPNSSFVYDPANDIAAVALNNNWIANASGTGPGSFGNSSLSFSGQSPGTILQTEVGSYAAVNAPGDYYVNYDTGIVYFYTDYAASAISYTASYDYLSLNRSWGISSSQNTSYNSAVFQYCNFSYMGGTSSSDTPALDVQNKLSAGADGGAIDRLFRLTNSTISDCYRFLSMEGVSGTTGDPILITNNTFNSSRGDSSTYYTIGFFRGAADSYIAANNNVLNLNNALLTASAWGSINTDAGLTISGNTGIDNVLVITSGGVVMAGAVVNNNVLTGYGAATAHDAVSALVGTAANPVTISGNHFSFMFRDVLFGPYNTITCNVIDHTEHHGMIPWNTDNSYVPGVVIENNLFFGLAGGPNMALPYAISSTFVEPGTNHNQWIDGFQVINNTFLDNYDGGFGIGPTLDTGFTTLTGGEWTDNLILNTFNGALVKGAGIKRPTNSTVERFQTQINDLDYNLFYNVGLDYLGINGGGTFLLNGTNYNTLPAGQRNITGVSLSQPGYNTPLASGQSLVFTVNSPGVDETLSWGGGSPVQLVFGHSTATSATNVTSYGVSGLWSGTLGDTSQSWTTSGSAYNTTPAGDWVEITRGTGAGQIRMIVANTATQLTVTPGWTVIPDSTSTYSIFKPEVTLKDNGAMVQGVTMTSGGSGYTSVPAVTFSGGGGSGAAGTAIIANGEVVGVTIASGGSGYTSAPTLTLSGGGGSGASAQPNLGTVQAGIDLRSLPASSQTDSRITLAFHDVNGNPQLANPVTGSTAADFALQAGSAAINTATSTDAPATDYFNTTRPQGANDIGFDQYIAPPPTLSPGSVPNADVGVPYTQSITASGGAGTLTVTYAFTGVDNTPGLSFTVSGNQLQISGTPTGTGSATFTVTASDSLGDSVTQTYSLTIGSMPALTPASVPGADVGVSYSQTITASGGTGSLTLTYAFNGADNTPGLSFTVSGNQLQISGTPLGTGSAAFSVTATDSTGASVTQNYSLVINPALTLSPGNLPNGVLGLPYTQTIAASGGTAPLTLSYAFNGGDNTPGLNFTVNSSQLQISGTPTSAGTSSFTANVTDSANGTASQTYTVTVNLALSPANLPAATVGIGYSQTVTASGGTAPYAYAIAAGSLPAGLNLSTNGVLSGTPTAGGAFNFTISATDSSGNTGSQTYSFAVNPATITISPKSLSSARVGVFYSNTLTASRGTAPYTFAATAGSLPAGLSLSTSGVLSGTPTAGGSFNFTVTATDSSTGTGPYSATCSYTFTVRAATISVSPGTVPAGTAGVGYSRTIRASGGTAPYTFAISAGSLPAGLSLSSGGLLSGTPTSAGSFGFTVTATDSSTGTGPYSGNQSYTLIVNLGLTPTTLSAAQVGGAYSQTITAAGGTAPYSLSVTAGALPAGLTLASSGLLSGTATAGGSFKFTVTATDSNGNTGQQIYTLSVRAAAIVITPTTMPAAAVGTTYSQTLTASGGTAPYTFTISSGSLPPGLVLSSSGVLSGTPTQAGTFNFTVKATDSSTGTGPYSGSQWYNFKVSAAAPVTASIATVASPGSVLTATAGPSGVGEEAALLDWLNKKDKHQEIVPVV